MPTPSADESLASLLSRISIHRRYSNKLGNLSSIQFAQLRELRDNRRGHLASVTDLEATLAKYVRGGCENIVAVGGDVTITALVNAMMCLR